jgi:hypothetical protein
MVEGLLSTIAGSAAKQIQFSRMLMLQEVVVYLRKELKKFINLIYFV